MVCDHAPSNMFAADQDSTATENVWKMFYKPLKKTTTKDCVGFG